MCSTPLQALACARQRNYWLHQSPCCASHPIWPAGLTSVHDRLSGSENFIICVSSLALCRACASRLRTRAQENHEGALCRCSRALRRRHAARLAHQVRCERMPHLRLATSRDCIGAEAVGVCADARRARCATQCASMACAARQCALRASTPAGSAAAAAAWQTCTALGPRRDVLQCSARRSGPSGEQQVLVQCQTTRS